MSAREVEAEAVKAAERSSGVGSNPSRMTSHIGDTVGCIWSPEVTDAISSLASPSLDTGNLVVMVSYRSFAKQASI
jgi:hypothetical protein